jgi:undecaprenyl diphosphate synthase
MENVEELKGVVKHLAIIMDGNGRWAQKRNLSRSEGHRAGAKTVSRVLDLIDKYGIKYLTLYAFSTENWKRPKLEVFALMSLLKEFLELNRDILIKKDVKLRVIGRISDIPLVTRRILKSVIEQTKNNKSGELILALSYGGRSEIVDAVKSLSLDVKKGKIDPKKIDENLFSNYLYAPDVPDPELMIRTSGEFRLSNFLLWQLSYSEFWVTNTLWPDFDEVQLNSALSDYKNRNRRYGRV